MAALTTTTAITTTTSRALVATLLQSLVFYLCVFVSVLLVAVWRYRKSVKRRFEIRDRCTARLWMTIEDLKVRHANRVSELKYIVLFPGHPLAVDIARSDELARLEEGLRSERDLSGHYARSVMDANQTRRDAEQQLAYVSEQLIAAHHDLEDARRHSEFSAQQREVFERKAALLGAHIKLCGYPAVVRPLLAVSVVLVAHGYPGGRVRLRHGLRGLAGRAFRRAQPDVRSRRLVGRGVRDVRAGGVARRAESYVRPRLRARQVV
jgi:hypothetical protein